MKILEYSPLGKELKKQTSVTKKQHQSIDKIFNHDEKEELVTIKKEPVIIKKKKPLKTDESSLVYDNKYSFNEQRNVGKYFSVSFTAKYGLLPFYHQLNEFRNFVP